MSQRKNTIVISTNNGIRGGFVDYSIYKGYCTGCALRILKNYKSNRCPNCNRLYRQKKKNKRADKLHELREMNATIYLVTNTS